MSIETPDETTRSPKENIDAVKDALNGAIGEKVSLILTAWQMDKNAYEAYKQEIRRQKITSRKPSEATLRGLRQTMYRELFDDLSSVSKTGFFGDADFHYILETDFGFDIEVMQSGKVFSVSVHKLRLNDLQWFESYLGMKAAGIN